MVAVISAPADWVEAVSNLAFPSRTDQRLQDLMDGNTEGKLSAAEQQELAALGEMSEMLSLVRADALRLLGRKPS